MKVGNVWAVGRNYVAHAEELNNPVPSAPIIFLKAGSCVTSGHKISWSTEAQDVHHEIELGFRFDQDLQISSMLLALDLTERTQQTKLKEASYPWTLAKSFVGACPVSQDIPIQSGLWSQPEFLNAEIQLTVNGTVRQQSPLSKMIFPPQMLAEWVKKRFPVLPGDLLLTGTPKGVGPLKSGDTLNGQLRGPQGTIWLRHEWNVQ